MKLELDRADHYRKVVALIDALQSSGTTKETTVGGTIARYNGKTWKIWNTSAQKYERISKVDLINRKIRGY